MKDPDEKPLDPEVERVRQRVMRFMGINIGLLVVAVMAVLVVIVYRTGVFSSAPENPAWAPPANGTVVKGQIALPVGAQALSQSLDGDRLAVLAQLAGGGRAIFVYDLVQNRVVARLDVTAGE